MSDEGIMKYIYVIKSFDINCWAEKFGNIAFNTENEARKFCEVNSTSSLFYSWDKVLIGKMKSPYPKKPKFIHLVP
jgi:hypothetical protein